MKVGSKARYAVMAIVDVARHSGSGAVPLAEVASRQKISLSYLEQLFAMLRKSGVVVSARGPGGGYRLAKPAEDTTIRSIFEAVDDPAPSNGGSDGQAAEAEISPIGELWSDLQDHIRDFLDNVSVGDVLAGRRAVPIAGDRPETRFSA
ncbi:MAG: Rrf2 family transcriptional regulator [Alphaproteobacteria bacterium]|nr:Rrf2 family transcriptional regulator [Alphaproteobacteria bacterium]